MVNTKIRKSRLNFDVLIIIVLTKLSWVWSLDQGAFQDIAAGGRMHIVETPSHQRLLASQWYNRMNHLQARRPWRYKLASL